MLWSNVYNFCFILQVTSSNCKQDSITTLLSSTILSVLTEKLDNSNVGFNPNIKITAHGHLSMLQNEQHAAMFP